MPTYNYVLVRRDLSPAQQAVQACHACLDLGKHFPWTGEHPHLVLVSVSDEPTLYRWARSAAGIPSFQVREFREPDLADSLTAVAVGNVSGQFRRFFASLPLIKLGEQIMVPVQGRWGFYPCGYETYLVLKQLNKLAFAARRRWAAWRRWNNKQPQNRVLRETIWATAACSYLKMDGSGSTYPGTRPESKTTTRPWPEPVVPGIDLETLGQIEADYRRARYPQQTATAVQPLLLPPVKMQELLTLLQTWAESA